MSTLSVPVYSSGLDDCTSEAVIVYAPKCLAEKKEIISQSILQPKKRLALVRCLGDEITAEEYKRLRCLTLLNIIMLICRSKKKLNYRFVSASRTVYALLGSALRISRWQNSCMTSLSSA
jgi:hypothetical protein